MLVFMKTVPLHPNTRVSIRLFQDKDKHGNVKDCLAWLWDKPGERDMEFEADEVDVSNPFDLPPPEMYDESNALATFTVRSDELDDYEVSGLCARSDPIVFTHEDLPPSPSSSSKQVRVTAHGGAVKCHFKRTRTRDWTIPGWAINHMNTLRLMTSMFPDKTELQLILKEEETHKRLYLMVVDKAKLLRIISSEVSPLECSA
jgi:hypothetical protein